MQIAWRTRVSWLFVLLPLLTLSMFPGLQSSVMAQTTIATGSIVGTVTDPSGAIVSGAKVTIINTGTNEATQLTTNSSGYYNSGAMIPGTYKIEVSAPGFSTETQEAAVQVGNTLTANVHLTVGQSSTTIEVQSSAVQVNTEQAEVQGVLSAQQIQQLPINGRNFLDLAQLEPGVQIQDGQNFDPTKAGYSSISFGGRFGRTARIEVDGVDVSDETVGTTTTDIPSSAIQEFQVAQSSLDISTELTSSGTVNVTTKSGTNRLHGNAFGFFRDYNQAAALPHPEGFPDPYTQRSQFGGNLGGPLWRDKLFLFGDGERTKQDEASPVQVTAPFSSYSGSYTSPFREGIGLGRLDANLPHGMHGFYRYNLYHSATDATFGFGFQAYTTKNQTLEHVGGLDAVTGHFSHSFRVSYLKFENQIVDAVRGSSLPFSAEPVSMQIGSLYVGPNYLAPQATPQSDKVVKYDGSWMKGNNMVRYGIAWNRTEAGGTADFFGIDPTVQATPGASEIASAAAGPFPGGSANPLNYPAETVIISNGVGFSTEKPGLGFAGGLLGPDNRIGLYLGDSWKPMSNMTIELALRYVRDTGRQDSDMPAIPQVNALYPGYGDRVQQPNLNLAPQFGLVWDPFKTGKTVLRAGAGLYYENVIYNNVLFDRPLRLTKGAFLNVQYPCYGSSPSPLPTSKGGTIELPAGVCGAPIGSVASQLAAFETEFQQDNPADPSADNGDFIGANLPAGFDIGSETNPSGFFDPDYKTPRSLQMNIGVQHQLKQGLVLSVDYLRNVETHSLLNQDINHVGDVNNFNLAAAQSAIAATNNKFGCADVNCAIAAGASISDYAGNGLTSAEELGGAAGCPNGACAFGGINPALGTFYVMKSMGRSVYNGLDAKLVGNVGHPFRGLNRLNSQVSYSFSRFVNTGGWNAGGSTGNSDQDFVIAAVDNRNPLGFAGPSLLDRTHQLSFGFVADVPAHFQLSSTAHFYSSLPQTLNMQSNGSGGEIFRTDMTGDGTTQDILPGTKMGSFDRDFSASGLNKRISDFNNTYANYPTPAGKQLVSSGLMNVQQLQALGATVQPIANAPAGQVNMAPLRTLDAKLSWVGTLEHERINLTPSIGYYNLFNFANFDLPGPTVMGGQLQNAAPAGSSVTPGYVNSSTYADRVTNRVGVGTGVFGLGSPRALEFGLDLSF